MTTTSAGLSPRLMNELAAALRGDLITPADAGYDQARAVYNAMIDKRPAAIARCRDAADVITCVRFAREHGVEIAVRGGGHNAAGLGVWDDALVIDLSLLRSTTVGPRESHRPRRPRMHLGRCRPRDRCFRHGHPVGLLRLHRRGRPDARRRHRLPVPALRPDGRQPARRRRGPGRRHASSRPARTPTATCSGRCAAAAGTSASSPRSPSAATTSASTARLSAARCCTTSPTPPR